MNKKGFTVIELMIAMMAGLIILIAAYSALDIGQKNAVSVGRKVMTQQDARLVLDYMAMDIRMASFNPTHAPNIWRNADATGTSIIPDDGNCGIRVATANRIFVEMDIGPCQFDATGNVISCGNGFIGDPNEVVSYTYDGIDTIFRSSGYGGGNQPMFGGAGTGTIVANNLAGVNVPLFQYFDRNGIATASIPAMRRVRITLVVRTIGAAAANQSAQMTYSTDVLLKNHPLSVYTP